MGMGRQSPSLRPPVGQKPLSLEYHEREMERHDFSPAYLYEIEGGEDDHLFCGFFKVDRGGMSRGV